MAKRQRFLIRSHPPLKLLKQYISLFHMTFKVKNRVMWQQAACKGTAPLRGASAFPHIQSNSHLRSVLMDHCTEERKGGKCSM